MTAELAQNTTTYHCIVCGPCLRELCEDGSVTIHQDIPHPDNLEYDDEENPQ